MIKGWASAAAIGLAALSAAGAAQATRVPAPAPAILPAFSGFGACTAGEGVFQSGNPCNDSGPSGQVTAFYVGTPFATAEVSASGGTGLSEGGDANLTYYYTVDGPNTTPVTVDITTNLLTSASLGSFSFAALNTSQGDQVCAQTNEGNCPGGDFHGTITELVTPGQIYSLTLETSATVNGAFGGTAFASADPFIGIDLNLNLNPDLYTLRVSDGIANAVPSGAPEPAGWAMMLLGFGGLGAMARAQRRGSRAPKLGPSQ
jgi:hypothetical protein